MLKITLTPLVVGPTASVSCRSIDANGVSLDEP
jgi:hypothetical protein